MGTKQRQDQGKGRGAGCGWTDGNTPLLCLTLGMASLGVSWVGHLRVCNSHGGSASGRASEARGCPFAGRDRHGDPLPTDQCFCRLLLALCALATPEAVLSVENLPVNEFLKNQSWWVSCWGWVRTRAQCALSLASSAGASNSVFNYTTAAIFPNISGALSLSRRGLPRLPLGLHGLQMACRRSLLSPPDKPSSALT